MDNRGFFIEMHETRFERVAIGKIFADEKLAKDPWWWHLLPGRQRRHVRMRDAEYWHLAHFQKTSSEEGLCVKAGWSAVFGGEVKEGDSIFVLNPDRGVRLIHR